MITSSCCLSTVIHASSSDLSYFHCHKGLSVIFLLYGCCVFLFLISSHLSLCTSFWSDEFLIWAYHMFVQATEHVHSLLEWCVFDLSMTCVCFFQSSDRCQQLTNGCCYLGLLEAFKVGCVTSNRKTCRITEMQGEMILYSLTERKLVWNAFTPAENKSQGWIRTSW